MKTEYLQRKFHVMSTSEEELLEDIRKLKQKLASKEAELDQLSTKGSVSPLSKCEKLTNDDISRYSRQMILPELRPEGQRRLLSSSALIVGCGGKTVRLKIRYQEIILLHTVKYFIAKLEHLPIFDYIARSCRHNTSLIE